jgi:hypothetical protein
MRATSGRECRVGSDGSGEATPRRPTLPAALLLSLALAPEALAGDLSGSALLAGTATSAGGFRSDLLEQQYSLGLLQPLTPYLTVRLGYQFFDLGTSFQDGTSFSRGSSQPLVEVLYNRDRLSSRVSFYQLSIDSSTPSENLDRRSLAASLSYKPTAWPGFDMNFRDDRNVADVSVFGRDVNSRLLDLTAFYNRRYWSASYTFETLAVENASNAFRTDQRRHEARASLQRSFWADRFSVGVSGRLSRLDRTTAVGEGAELAEPVPAAAGLFAVDTSPEVGELAASPSLVDGDATTPASPPVEIGGASTYRNVGLDLGVTRPITRLEIVVDVVSSPSVVWQVYHSRDNLFWEAVPGATSTFDSGLLRYVVRLPETQDRFFKAVNVSTNAAPAVRVTEVRALLDLAASALDETTDDTRYRGDLLLGFNPARRVNLSLGLGASSDEVLTAGLVRRDYREAHALARLTVDLARGLDLNLAYRYNDSENRREPVLLRTVSQYNANLVWKPLPTVDAALSVGRRNESEETTLLQAQDSARLAVALQLLADLRYVTDLDVARVRDPFGGRDRNSWTWIHTLEARPLPRWDLAGSFTLSRNRTPDGQPLLDRTQYQVWTTWSPTAYLSLTGSWWYTDDGGRTSLNQSYNVSYAPGDRLTVSATYQGYEDFGGVGTATDSLSAAYRLFTQFLLFANLSRSTTKDTRGESLRVSNFRAGLQLAF